MYCSFSLHDVEVRRLKYAPEPAPSTTKGWRLLRRCRHCYLKQTSLIQFGQHWTQNRYLDFFLYKRCKALLHCDSILTKNLIDLVKFIRAFSGLTVQRYVFRKIGDIQFRNVLKYHCLVIGLTQKANHFSMAMLPVNVDVVLLIKGVFDSVL